MRPTVVLTARRRGRFLEPAGETTLLARELAARAWEVVFADWRDITGFASDRAVPAATLGANLRATPDALPSEILVVNKYLGSLRDRQCSAARAYLGILRDAGVPTVNDPRLFDYGRMKDYVLDLQSLGFPVPRTLYFSSSAPFEDVVRESQSLVGPSTVVKPHDGELCQDVHRLDAMARADWEAIAVRTDGVLVQPFMDGIRDGQRSAAVVVISGTPVIAYGVQKTPHGWLAHSSASEVAEVQLSAQERDLAVEVLSGWPGGHIHNGFARVDFVTQNGDAMILEVETVNPGIGLDVIGSDAACRYAELFSQMLECVASGVSESRSRTHAPP